MHHCPRRWHKVRLADVVRGSDIRCILAGQVGAAGHLTIGDGATLTAQSGVPTDIPPGAVYSGYPAMDNLAWRKSVAVFNRLPELQTELRELRAEVARLRANANPATD